MNFKVNPIILSNLISKMEPTAPYGNSSITFLKCLSVNNPDTWTFDSISRFMADRSNLAAAIVSSPEMCNSPKFIHFLFSTIIYGNIRENIHAIAIKCFEDFMLLKNTDRSSAFEKMTTILTCVPLHLSILGMMRLEGLLDVYETQQKHMVDSAWEKHFSQQTNMREYGSPKMPEQSGWSGPTYMRSSTPESFAASPAGQRYHAQNQQPAQPATEVSKENDEQIKEDSQIAALAKGAMILTKSIQTIHSELIQQRKEIAALKAGLPPAPVKTPLMVKPKRTFIKKEPKA